jgi:hypothetical protein
MQDRLISSVAALRRKLRALGSVIADPAATAPEKANAEALKQRLEQRLRAAEPPSSGGWTDKAFRLGQWVKEMRKSAPPAAAAEADWTDNARRIGKIVGRGYRKWLSG